MGKAKDALTVWRFIHSVRALRGLRSWDRDTLLAYQASCVRAVVAHAARQVPYYTRLFAEVKLDAEAIRTPADLTRVPISTRRSLQALAPTALVARGVNPNRLVNLLSSGSTGEPFTTRRSRLENLLLLAFRMRVYQTLGAKLLDRWAGVRWLGPEAGEIAADRVLVPRRGRTISCLAPAERQAAELRRAHFEILGGLPASLAEAAEFLTEKDRVTMQPRIVVTGGETSTTELRKNLSEVFRAPVYDIYGTNEFIATAWQCPETGLYHVSDPTVVLEVVDEKGESVPPGEEGEVVVTGLHAFAMPFIRYRLDDLAVRGETPCPCGAPWSTLARILGRVSERFVLPDGRKIHPYALQEAFMRDAPWLQGFQIVQETLGLVTLRLRPLRGQSAPADSVARAISSIRQVLGQGVEVRAELVDELPRGGRGKALHYVCLVR